METSYEFRRWWKGYITSTRHQPTLARILHHHFPPKLFIIYIFFRPCTLIVFSLFSEDAFSLFFFLVSFLFLFFYPIFFLFLVGVCVFSSFFGLCISAMCVYIHTLTRTYTYTCVYIYYTSMFLIFRIHTIIIRLWILNDMHARKEEARRAPRVRGYGRVRAKSSTQWTVAKQFCRSARRRPVKRL